MTLLHQNKKRRESGEKKCHPRTMLHSKAGEAYKMSAHHVPLRQSVEEIRLGKEQEEGGHD